MLVQDLRNVAEDEQLAADFCIIGSGPAGVTLLRELAGNGFRIILVESGDLNRQPQADALNEIENVGAPREIDQSLMRCRALGGTSTIWTGRCAPLDDIDYQPRPWVPHSGWPISPEEMTPFLDRSKDHLGLGLGSGFTDAGYHRRTVPRNYGSGVDPRVLRPFFWQFSQDTRRRSEPMRFAQHVLEEKGGNVQIITNATVIHLNTNEAASAVESVEVAAPTGERRTIAASAIILCAGGIENARLLLASNRVEAAGLGNRYDVVGRFLMDHPRCSVAMFDHTDADSLHAYFGLHRFRIGGGAYLFYKGLRLSPDVQEREGLLNCAMWLREDVAEDDPWRALNLVLRSRRARGMWQGSRAILSNLDLFARGLYRGAFKGGSFPRKFARLELNCTVEQRPDPESRITLSDRCDRNGMPLARLNWCVSGQELQTMRRAAQLVTQELRRLRAAVPVPNDWVVQPSLPPADLQDAAHHIGSTRMSLIPRDGVVDRNCQVHGVRGLYVAGSSTFPTAGHANPTQMVVALAIRLADLLKRRIREPQVALAARLVQA